jgi:NAD(P)-dependent dehydrogenase (short-subunit alcohol dehydrogenase family)
LHAFRNDISRPDERLRLAEYIKSQFPNLNIVINNAGIQRRIALAADNAPWVERQAEIDTLLAAPIHLNHLLIPLMLKHGRPGSIKRDLGRGVRSAGFRANLQRMQGRSSQLHVDVETCVQPNATIQPWRAEIKEWRSEDRR